MSTDNETETTRVTRKGQVTIPKDLRDEVRWEIGDDGIVVRKANRSAGRGMLVDEDVDESTREEIAEELEADIRERRRTEWVPE
jgi:AbrB family looped-hinge helix DNA binding protein